MKTYQSKTDKLDYVLRKKIALGFYVAAAVTAGLVGCSSPAKDPAYEKADTLPSYQQTSFESYVADTKAWLTDNRLFMTADHQEELAQVLPHEYRPASPNGQGVLLVHGLGD